MSRVLVIPDVHLKTQMFDLAESVDKGKYDNIVCLGDYVDDWGKGNDKELYEKTLDRVAEFAAKHKEAFL